MLFRSNSKSFETSLASDNVSLKKFAYIFIDLIASSLPGITKSIGSGLELESDIAIIGIESFLASKTANLSLTISKITKRSGLPPRFRKIGRASCRERV